MYHPLSLHPVSLPSPFTLSLSLHPVSVPSPCLCPFASLPSPLSPSFFILPSLSFSLSLFNVYHLPSSFLLCAYLISFCLPPSPSFSPLPDSFRPGDRVGCIQKKSDQNESFALKALSVDSLRPFIPEYIQTVVKDAQSIHF